jgi:hypothetical protein
MLYTITITFHVVVAVVGIGLVGGVPLTARLARQGPGLHTESERILGVLVRAMQLAFFAMVATGILLDVSAHGAFHRTGWFQASIAVLAVNGLVHARARSALGKGSPPESSARPRYAELSAGAGRCALR